MLQHLESPLLTPEGRRNTLPPRRRRPFSPLKTASPPKRPGTTPTRTTCNDDSSILRGCGEWSLPWERQGERERVEVGAWVKKGWRKGQCRKEIKLVAETAGIPFEEARGVVLRLYNHFQWQSQLSERASQLRVTVAKERRLSLTAVGQAATNLLAARASQDSGAARAPNQAQRQRLEGAQIDSTVEGVGDDKTHFSRYIRGLCMLCQRGTFEELSQLLFSVYSLARGDRMISRDELATVLAKHVAYEDCQDPQAERERAYRWLKRQYIRLGSVIAPPENDPDSGGMEITALPITRPCVSDTLFMSWNSARELLRRGAPYVTTSLAVDLPSLAKDLWAADVFDARRTAWGES